MKNKKGFTLAEVLITLSIIGVVAALTIPSLIQSSQERQTVAILRNTLTIMIDGYSKAVTDNGPITEWSNSATIRKDVFETFVSYFKTAKTCTPTGEVDCWADATYKRLYGADWVNVRTTYPYAFILANGSVIGFNFTAASIAANSPITCADYGLYSKGCVSIYVDTNGTKPPNVQGIDFFGFFTTESGSVIPGGAPNVNINQFSTCNTVDGTGWGCAAWLIYNENMDYLHCSNLSWSGPTKCQ